MQPGYVFALACLGLSVFNAIRAFWFYRRQQKMMMGFSLCFLGIALTASAYMGYTAWQADKQQETTANETHAAPATHAEGPYSQTK